MTRPVTVSTVAFDGHPLGTAIDELARLDVRLIEPAFIKGYMDFAEADFEAAGAARVGRQMRDAGVSALAISAHMDTGQPEAAAMLARRIRFASAIGARFVITNATGIGYRDGLMRTLAANIDLAGDLGITIALENPGYGPDNLMQHGAAAADLIRALGMEQVRLNYDTSNALTCSEGKVLPEEDIEAALPFCAHLHLKDVLLRADRWSYTAIGQGAVNYAALMPKLSAHPDLPLTIELPLSLVRMFGKEPFRDPDLVPLPIIRQAIARSIDFVTASISAQAAR
jgi:sugar phosphate isomerase/epimerase